MAIKTDNNPKNPFNKVKEKSNLEIKDTIFENNLSDVSKDNTNIAQAINQETLNSIQSDSNLDLISPDAIDQNNIVTGTPLEGDTGPLLQNITNLTEAEPISADFFEVTKHIVDLANIHSAGKVISFLEGGYDLLALSESIKYHLLALKS